MSKRIFEGGSFDSIYEQLIRELISAPDHESAPRGQRIRESLAVTLVLTDPRGRVLENSARGLNCGFAVGEFIWYWQGKRDLETMLYYNRRMADFSDDGRTLNSAYGHRMMGSWMDGELSQWNVCVKTLLDDPDSRRAVLLINSAADQRKAAGPGGSKDVPCTLSLQFFVRRGRLDLHVHMRSNDAVWGLSYDLFSFTMFQEMMLLTLRTFPRFVGLELGTYYHTAGSLHIYERHFELADRISGEYLVDRLGPIHRYDHAPPMEPVPGLDEMVALCRDERLLREGTVRRIDESAHHGGLRWMAGSLNQHRNKRDAEQRV